ncbi:MAG: hypothetical protein H7834_00835 [Magnetococcus sp. YQC-9]
MEKSLKSKLNRNRYGMRGFSQGCVQDAQSRFQKAETTPAKAARGAFFAKGAKNASWKERAKVKGKTLGEESPRPSLFFHQ